MAKNSDACLRGLLEIPLGTSRTGPMKSLVADLHHIARELNRARNATVEAWLWWRRAHPEWIAPIALDDDGEPKRDRAGNTIPISPMAPIIVTRDGEPGTFEQVAKEGRAKPVWTRTSDGVEGLTFETYLYHVATAAAPDVAAILISSVVKEAISNLKTNDLYKRGHKYRWQAVLCRDEQIPTFVDAGIPVPNNSSAFVYAGLKAGKRTSDLAEFWGKASAVLSVPLWSKPSGRNIKAPVFTINVGSRSSGDRQILKRIASGEWKWCDSKLVFKNDRWQVQMTYEQPSHSLGLNAAQTATIWPCFHDAAQPFVIETEGDRIRRWNIGNGKWLAAEYDRLTVRRLRIRNRYREALPGMKGHGREHIEGKFKQWANRTRNLQRHFTWQLIKEVVRFCRRNNCGRVVFREPSVQNRGNLWFGKNDVPYNWTSLTSDLAHKMRYYGIEFEIESVNADDLKAKFASAEVVNKTPGIARVPESKAPVEDPKGGLTVATLPKQRKSRRSQTYRNP